MTADMRRGLECGSVAEHLPCMLKALRSTPSTGGEKRNEGSKYKCNEKNERPNCTCSMKMIYNDKMKNRSDPAQEKPGALDTTDRKNPGLHKSPQHLQMIPVMGHSETEDTVPQSFPNPVKTINPQTQAQQIQQEKQENQTKACHNYSDANTERRPNTMDSTPMEKMSARRQHLKH